MHHQPRTNCPDTRACEGHFTLRPQQMVFTDRCQRQAIGLWSILFFLPSHFRTMPDLRVPHCMLICNLVHPLAKYRRSWGELLEGAEGTRYSETTPTWLMSSSQWPGAPRMRTLALCFSDLVKAKSPEQQRRKFEARKQKERIGIEFLKSRMKARCKLTEGRKLRSESLEPGIK